MKLTTLIFLNLFLFNTSRAQQWAQPGSVWTYTFSDVGWTTVRGYNEIRFDDTLTVDNRLCHNLSLFNMSFYPNAGGYVQYNYGNVITNLNQQVLTYRSGQNRFDTIAIFNAAPGAHWYERLGFMTSNTVTPRRITVRDTGHAIINGYSLKFLNVNYGDSISVFTNTCNSCFYRIYELIGPTRGYMYLTHEGDYLDAYDAYGTFVCYYDNNFAPYSINGYSCTRNPVLISENTAYDELSFFPNPTKDKLQIEGLYGGDMILVNSNGIEVLKADLLEGTNSIDLENLPQGLYFLKVEQNGKASIHKIVKN